MAFDCRRELLFLYSVKDANPNGDPLNANHPRFDDDTEQILVSDVRIKRTVRDQWLRERKNVFVDGVAQTLKERVNALKKEVKGAAEKVSAQEALRHCIDVRLFGVTFALDKESFSWTGPVQFKWGRSLHRCEVMAVQGTAAFATKESSAQRSFRSEYIVPFSLIAAYGIANQYASATTGATEEDIEALAEALWKGTGNLITRSKIGHTPRLLMEVCYNADFDGIIGAMDEKVSLKSIDGSDLSPDVQRALRSCGEVRLETGPLLAALRRVEKDIKSVRLFSDPALAIVGLEDLRSLLGEKLILEER